MIDKDALTQLAADNPCANDLFVLWSQRERNQSETRVGRALDQLIDGGSTHTRSGVVKAFQALEDCGCGKFVMGRRGRKSRFVWSESIIRTSLLALGLDDGSAPAADDEIETDEATEEPEWMVHSFNLRADLEVEFELPADLTDREAERLANFMESLAL